MSLQEERSCWLAAIDECKRTEQELTQENRDLRGQLRELEDKLTYANDVKAERARCLAGARAMRAGLIDDIRTLIRFIQSGDSADEFGEVP